MAVCAVESHHHDGRRIKKGGFPDIWHSEFLCSSEKVVILWQLQNPGGGSNIIVATEMR